VNVGAARAFVILLGVVSLLGDTTYEGARSILGPYLLSLGASAAVVGGATGLGELAGYLIRLPSGALADRTRRYWPLTIAGYLVNLLSVPPLALVTTWQPAVGLAVVERFGRGIRAPARDALLATAATKVGAGWAFGVHEAMDQIGAVVGPLFVSAVLFIGLTHRDAFALLAVPALLALGALFLARARFAAQVEPKEGAPSAASPRRLLVYAVFAALTIAGFAQFPLIAYHLAMRQIVAEPVVPLLFAGATAVSSGAAFGAGVVFDRAGLRAVAAVPALTLAATPLVFSESVATVITGLALWGVALGAAESTIRAAVAHVVPARARGTAYGIFNAIYGTALFLGGLALGAAYDRGPSSAIAMAVALEAAALVVAGLLLRSRVGSTEGR
jgi:MFS family permease